LGLDMDQLRQVYWLGGGSRAGKSTIARRIAATRGFQLYSTDVALAEHASRSSAECHPLLAEFIAMDMDERWVNRSPETMLETFPWFRGECFEMIIDDLLQFPKESPVIVEGYRLLPRLVLPFLAIPCHAVWLIPTPRFRETIVNNSGRIGWEFLSRTSNPERALRNLLERDRIFTDWLLIETNRTGLSAIAVDTGASEDNVAELVMEKFGV
jgi:hypothetical protein